MVHSVVKRKIGNNNLGRLTERRSGANVKDNLLKDIYNLYLLGEGSIESLHFIKSDTKFQHQEVQTQTDSCLGNTLFASKAEVEAVKNDLLKKLADLREEFVASSCPPPLPLPFLPSSPIQNNPVLSSQPLSVSAASRNTNREPDEANNSLNSNYNDDQPKAN